MTLVHIHEGETIYYEDSCYVCEAQNTEAVADDSPWSVIESVKYRDPELRKPPRWEVTWYDLLGFFRMLTFFVAFVASCLTVIIMFDLITRGSVRW